MAITGLPSGTVYPALRRLERDGFVDSKWESELEATAKQRPARRYYEVNQAGLAAAQAVTERYPLLARLAPERSSVMPVTPLHLPGTDRALVYMASWLVPCAERKEWRRSWEAELWHARNTSPQDDTTTHLSPLSLGLVRDALWLHLESWTAFFAERHFSACSHFSQAAC